MRANISEIVEALSRLRGKDIFFYISRLKTSNSLPSCSTLLSIDAVAKATESAARNLLFSTREHQKRAETGEGRRGPKENF